VKGFVMDDERLSEGRVKKTYFEEWEERIRRIRTSEANFYQKVRDVLRPALIIIQRLTMPKTFSRRFKTNSILPSPDLQRRK